MSTNKSAANRQTSNDPTHPVSDQLAESLHSTVDALHNTAAKTEEQLRSKSDASGQAIQAQKRLLEKKWNASGVKQYATENPVKTAGIAFGAGVLLTMLLRSK
ncbi:hypothetical protein CWB99_19130 [Pseudoalteromonas rubra]|uniref:DUF883 domain-containing protein n=1 Tax=Pseudoalteromonas rubra TaxID=43658 RepID=A0A5S3WGY8_9GAMM|nr:DUF883 C-terminal domain-containing protein [Pseudoalteromonas rubra]TMP26418.1 hypothetical protein CWB99_19130 [Pseudoalteromonas rubra]TMP29711.1 hypothetical protein CWC00_18680 [Pseudoalteromonas rubra]